MDIIEISADDDGETHFRTVSYPMSELAYAPPSKSVEVTGEIAAGGSMFLRAPAGWDERFHATPRRQLAVLLAGRIEVTVSDGEVRSVGPGAVVLLNDAGSKGHRTLVTGPEPALFLLVGTEAD